MTTDRNIEIVARAVVDWRSKDADVRDRTKYHRKAVPSVIAEHGERIRELLEAFPLAPVDSIVYAIETGDTRNLANSCAVGNVVELVQSERLTREQRIAAMEAQGAPKRFIDRRGSTS